MLSFIVYCTSYCLFIPTCWCCRVCRPAHTFNIKHCWTHLSGAENPEIGTRTWNLEPCGNHWSPIKGESDLGYIKPLTSVVFWRHSEPAVPLTPVHGLLLQSRGTLRQDMEQLCGSDASWKHSIFLWKRDLRNSLCILWRFSLNLNMNFRCPNTPCPYIAGSHWKLGESCQRKNEVTLLHPKKSVPSTTLTWMSGKDTSAWRQTTHVWRSHFFAPSNIFY